MSFRKYREIGISTLAFLVAAALIAEPNITPKVELSIVSAERKDSKSSTVKWTIVNHREHPILFPRAAAGNWIYTIEIEQLDREKGWTTLPTDREWTHSDSDTIKLGPGETYRYSFDLPDDFTLPRWVTFPRPVYSIPLNTELRLNVTYFEDEQDWEAYRAELKTGSPHWARMERLLKKWGQQAFSEPFMLPAAAPPKAPEPITLEEAEVLIYLLPQAHELRSKSMDVSWELETGKSFNQNDFYIFWVVNSKRPNVQGSVTVGYFAVNKHSAEVWSLDANNFVSSSELEGIQRIIRTAHAITEPLIQQYHSRRPDTPADTTR